MNSRHILPLGAVRGIDTAAGTKINLRRFPLPVSKRRAPVMLSPIALCLLIGLPCVACLAGGIAIGVLGYGWANLHGLLP